MIDKATALTLTYRQTLYHATLRNKDGSAVRCRVSGRVKEWKTRPDDFAVPVKHGLKDSFYITNMENFSIRQMKNAHMWLVEDPVRRGEDKHA